MNITESNLGEGRVDFSLQSIVEGLSRQKPELWGRVLTGLLQLILTSLSYIAQEQLAWGWMAQWAGLSAHIN